MIGMEVQKPSAGGGAVTIFKRGQAPKNVSDAIDKGTDSKDEEKAGISGDGQLNEQTSMSSESERKVKGIATNESIFTFSNVNYTIPYGKSERKLLSDVQGYVRPGKLTALMGASGAGKTTLLDVIAGRMVNLMATGGVLLNNTPVTSQTLAANASFVAQVIGPLPCPSTPLAWRIS